MPRSLAFDNSRLAEEFVSPVGRRGAARLRLSIPARLITLTDTRRCILVDLSRSGAQIGLASPLGKGDCGVLEIADFEMFGAAVRTDIGANGGTNGLHFDTQLSDNQVLAVRHYSESFEEHQNAALRREVRQWVSGLS